jgi:hypothetical protein
MIEEMLISSATQLTTHTVVGIAESPRFSGIESRKAPLKNLGDYARSKSSLQ